MTSLTKQRGAAIIIALFVVAIAVTATAIMIERLRIDLRRTELLINANRAYLYSQGSILWAIDTLNNNWKNKQPNQLTDRTPIKSGTDNQDGVTISSTIYDAQGYFNLNSLAGQVTPESLNSFILLVQAVAPEIGANEAQNIAMAIVDWTSPDTNNPAFDEYYLKLNPSYRSPHREMANLSELRLVKGVTPSLFSKLSPYVIALPKTTLTNINNAEAPVILSLSTNQNMSLSSAKIIEKAARQAPFLSMEEFKNLDVIQNNPIDFNKITFLSNYFLVQTNVTLGQQRLTLYTLLERETKDAESKTSVLWQSKGTL